MYIILRLLLFLLTHNMWVFIDSHMSTLTLIKVYIWTYYSDVLFCSVFPIKQLIRFIHNAPTLMSVSLITLFHFGTFEPVERYGSFRVFASKPTLTERSLKLGCHLLSVPIRKKLSLMYAHFNNKKAIKPTKFSSIEFNFGFIL